MNLFDIVGLAVLAVSALLGLGRGAVREIVALVAFTGSAAVSVWLLPLTGPFAHARVHPAWASNAVAIGVAFLVAYFAIRLFGARLSEAMRGHATLGPIDRTLGFAFGVTRALVLLGVVYLVFKATPSHMPPPMIGEAKIYPLARGSGLTLVQLAPGGMERLEDFGATLRARMSGEEPGEPLGPLDPALRYGPTPGDAPPEPAARRTLRVESGGSMPRGHATAPSSTASQE